MAVNLSGCSGPQVSVVMAAFNAAEFLRQAIDSILQQSFADFEFIIIDDGSSDATAEIVLSYSDPRIRFVKNPRNLGLVASLNLGLQEARGEFVARMDADDESLPCRLEEQVRFLNAHPGIGLCGTQIETIGARAERWHVECDPKRLRCHLLFSTGISHPTVMFRRTLVSTHRLYYDPAYPVAQDYELWVRFAQVTEIANLPTVQLRYRLHAQSVTTSERGIQDRLADQIRRDQLRRLGLEPTEREMFVHTTLIRGSPRTLSLAVDEAEDWLIRLLRANEEHRLVDHGTLAGMLYEMWFKLCRAHRRNLRSAPLRFLRSPVARFMPLLNRFVDGVRLLAASWQPPLSQPTGDVDSEAAQKPYRLSPLERDNALGRKAPWLHP